MAKKAMVHRRRFLKIYSLKFWDIWQEFYFYRILNIENFKMNQSISWTVHVRAEAQKLKNSAEYFKIDPGKKRWRLQVAEAAMAVNEGTRVAKTRFLTWNSAKESCLKTLNVLSSKIIYFSLGLQRNSRQDVNVLVTAISRHVRCLLNIGEGKSCFSCLMI